MLGGTTSNKHFSLLSNLVYYSHKKFYIILHQSLNISKYDKKAIVFVACYAFNKDAIDYCRLYALSIISLIIMTSTIII